MRLVIATLYPNIGGSTKVLLAAADALRADHSVTVRAPIAQANSIADHAVPLTSLAGLRAKLTMIPTLLKMALREGRWLRRQRVDALYVHDELSLYVYGTLAALFRIPLVWHVHMREGRGLARWLRDSLCVGKIFVADFMIGPSQRRPWVRIRNPVIPFDRGEPRPNEGRRGLRVGMVGSISLLKNQMLAIQALAQLRRSQPDATLTVFGDTLDAEYRERCVRAVAELGLQHAVAWRGFVPMAEALQDVDVFVTCSTHESFGLATLEALSSGLPVAASDIPAHREIAGILGADAMTLAPLTPDAMADAILEARPISDAADRIEAAFGASQFNNDMCRYLPRLLVAAHPGNLRDRN